MKHREYYDNINFLRCFAAIGILSMHVLHNGEFSIGGGGYIVDQVIKSMGILVRLFFAISGFSICCGYYDKAKSMELDYGCFLKKRYIRILPFYSVLICLYAVEALATARMSLLNIFVEAVTDASLLFGLFPGATELSIVGLGWTLGPIFAFYILFPFFAVCCWTKRRAVASLLASIVISLVCTYYFKPNQGSIRSSIMVQAVYFITGMVVYLFRDDFKQFIAKTNRADLCSYLFTFAGLAVLICIPSSQYSAVNMIVSVAGCIFALFGTIGNKMIFFSNKIVTDIANVSLEIYLSHAFIFGVINRLHLTHLFGNEVVNYTASCLITLVCAFAGAMLWKIATDNFGSMRKAIWRKHEDFIGK